MAIAARARPMVGQANGPRWWVVALIAVRPAYRVKRLAVWPVVDEDGYILGVLMADRVTSLLAGKAAWG